MRQHKLQLHRKCKEIQRLLRREVLQSCLQGWRNRTGATMANEIDYAFNFTTSLLASKLNTGCRLIVTSRKLRKYLSQTKQQAIRKAIEVLPTDSSASTILNKLKPTIGSTNHQKRQVQPLPAVLDEHDDPCRDPTALQDRWVDFFRIMEGGERLSKAVLRDHWIQTLQTFMQQEITLEARDLPTLTDLETAFRRVQCHKAIGEDQIPPELCHFHPARMARMAFSQMLKLCTHGQEALLHKGGELVAAWKRKGPQNRCESYRSLLISSHIAKSLHRAVRSHQSTVYEAFLQSEQLGGRKCIPVSLGVHFIRAAARHARKLHHSHAMIFLDLREAFYRVLRPISVGGSMPDELLASVAARLQLPADALAELHQLLLTPPSTELAGMPEHMRRALRALHTCTHFFMKGQSDRVHTRIGSRPGDPFADVIFGYMFARILHTVEQRLADLHILEIVEDSPTKSLFPTDHHTEVAPHSMLGPTWMDDLCITISHPTAKGIEHKAGTAASVLLETCTYHGVTPNLDKGKSEILFTFRGCGSRSLRTKYFSENNGRTMPVVTEHGSHRISVVGNYIHLGSAAHHTGSSHREMRRRIAMGNTAFAGHRRVLLQNPAFTLPRRAQLFQSLVLSKVVYGMESWTFDQLKQQRYFKSAVIRLYRRLAKVPHDAPLQDDEILAQVHLPDPDHLLRIARLRYLGMLYKCEDVTPWAFFRFDQEWTTLLQGDLTWLWNLISGTCLLGDPTTHFAEWEYVLRYHRSYWKTLLQRGAHLSVLKQQDTLLLRKLHHDVLAHLEQQGELTTAPVRPALDPHQQHHHYGCMQCGKRCRTKAGEAAHMFRAHGVTATERRWIAGTTCEACLKEYHSYDKLQKSSAYSHASAEPSFLCARIMPSQHLVWALRPTKN